jgi:hypothetical protein
LNTCSSVVVTGRISRKSAMPRQSRCILLQNSLNVQANMIRSRTVNRNQNVSRRAVLPANGSSCSGQKLIARPWSYERNLASKNHDRRNVVTLDVVLCTPMKSCHLMCLVNLNSWRTGLAPGVGRFITFAPTPKERTCDRWRNQAESNTWSTFFDQIYKMWSW